MYDTTVAAKLLKQLESFWGRISPHFHKPVARFIGDMIYGIMVEKDVKLASIVRALKERITPKKVEDRLSRMLSSEGLEAGLHGGRLRKRGRRPVPLHFRLWSADSPGFVSEGDEVEMVVDEITRHTKRRGIFVYDRGGDNIEFFKLLLKKGVDFIVRLKERYVRSWKRKWMCDELAWECRMRYREVVSFTLTAPWLKNYIFSTIFRSSSFSRSSSSQSCCCSA